MEASRRGRQRWARHHRAVSHRDRDRHTALPGAPPRFFRTGTAYSDDVADRIVTAMAARLVTFSVKGDGGATFTPEEVRSTVTAAAAGSIVLCHMNHPSSGTAQGIAASVPHLMAAGYRFVRLSGELR